MFISILYQYFIWELIPILCIIVLIHQDHNLSISWTNTMTTFSWKQTICFERINFLELYDYPNIIVWWIFNNNLSKIVISNNIRNVQYYWWTIIFLFFYFFFLFCILFFLLDHRLLLFLFCFNSWNIKLWEEWLYICLLFCCPYFLYFLTCFIFSFWDRSRSHNEEYIRIRIYVFIF